MFLMQNLSESIFSLSDHVFMEEALSLAAQAESLGEVPVGAVVVLDGQIVGTGFNRVITDCDPSAHAEIVAIRDAAQRLKNYRLPDCQLFVTLEPCLMCVGSIFHSRISRIVFGAADPKTGACGSVFDALSIEKLNHHAVCQGGLMAEACGKMLSDFFLLRRAQRKREA